MSAENTNGIIYPIIINSSSLVNNQFDNTYTYQFPQGSVQFKGSKVAVGSVNMYYSWFNITATNNNNSYEIIWPVGAGTSTFTVTMPDGSYDVSGLNTYLQQFCVTNGLYLINGAGDYVYYMEFVENSAYYAVQLNTYPIPLALPAGWSAPGTFPGFPAVSTFTPQLVVSANNFTTIIGFSSGTYPNPQQTTTYSVLSTSTPQLSIVQSVLLSCGLLKNRYSNPNTILYSFTTGGTTFGNLISSSPSFPTWVPIQDGSYNDFQIRFLDQDYNDIIINDTNIVITLLIWSPS